MYHILVVDDDKEIRSSLQIYLEEEGYRVTLCADGQQNAGTDQQNQAGKTPDCAVDHAVDRRNFFYECFHEYFPSKMK